MPFSLKRTGIVAIAAGLFVFLLYLYFVGLGDVVNEIIQADPFFYSSAFAAMVLSVVFYSLTWQRLLQILSVKSSFFKAFQFVWVGSFVDLLVPAESISGDISRVYLMSREYDENAGKVVASVVGHRVLAMTITLGGLVISAIYFVVRYHPPILVMEFIGVVGAGTIIAMVLIFYLSRKRQATEKVVNWVIGLLVRFSRGRWRFDRLKKQAEKMLKAFHDGIDTLGVRPSRLVLPVFLAIVAWILDLLVSTFVFRALSASVSFSAIVIVYSISVAFQTIPIGIPGEVGVLDVVMATLYYLLGIPIEVSAGATVLIRFLTLWIRLLIGGLTVQWVGVKGLKAPTASS